MNGNPYRAIVLSLSGALFLLLLFLLLSPIPLRATPSTYFVIPHGGGDCSQASPCDLQSALAMASDGDTLYLAEGTYTGTGSAVITASHTLTLYGGWDGTLITPPMRDPDHHPTVLDGEGVRRGVFIVRPLTLTLDGIGLVRGNASADPDYPAMGGGLFSRYGTPILVHCLISGNVASNAALSAQGGGVYISDPAGVPLLQDNRFISNVANLDGWGSGGGLYLLNAPHTQLLGNVFLSNTATLSGTKGYGGGVAVFGSSERVLCAQNEVRNNVSIALGDGHSSAYGGGLMFSGAAAQIRDNLILSNTAIISGGLGYGGGIAMNASEGCTVEENQIEFNVAQRHQADVAGSYGGGIYAMLSRPLLIRGNRIRFNVASLADRGGGGGITLWWHCDDATLADNVIEHNVGAVGNQYGYGGGLYLYVALNAHIESNRIRWNNAGGLPYGGGGGGLYLWRNTSFTMTNNLVVGNQSAADGAGMKLVGWVDEPITGTLAHNTFAANEQNGGQGIAIDLDAPRITLVMTNNLIADHNYGLYAEAGTTATLEKTLFYANVAGETGGNGFILNHAPITGQDPRLTTEGLLGGGSAAVNAALTLPWVTVDIEGDPRPFGAAADIGADEYIATLALPMILRQE